MYEQIQKANAREVAAKDEQIDLLKAARADAEARVVGAEAAAADVVASAGAHIAAAEVQVAAVTQAAQQSVDAHAAQAAQAQQQALLAQQQLAQSSAAAATTASELAAAEIRVDELERRSSAQTQLGTHMASTHQQLREQHALLQQSYQDLRAEMDALKSRPLVCPECPNKQASIDQLTERVNAWILEISASESFRLNTIKRAEEAEHQVSIERVKIHTLAQDNSTNKDAATRFAAANDELKKQLAASQASLANSQGRLQTAGTQLASTTS